MRYLSVCSGIEAATVAWHSLGWTPAAFSEIEAFPRAVLTHHYPQVPLHGDFTTIGAGTYGPVDLLVGGTPCQSFSVAGLRKGLADERGNLALEFLKLAHRTRARWVVWENVPGVLSSNGGRDFGAFLGGLVELGYWFAYRVLDAQYVRVDSHPRAVPQRRRRVFVVGHLGDWRRAAAVLLERESMSGHPAPRREARERAAATLTGSTGGVSQKDDADGPLVAPTLDASFAEKWGLDNQHIDAGGGYSTAKSLNAHGCRLDSETETLLPVTGGSFDVAHSLRADGFDASEDRTGRGTPLIAETLTANGDAHSGYRDERGLLPVALDTYNQTVTGDTTQTLCSRGDSPGGNAHLVPAVAFDWQAGGSGDESFRGKSRSYIVRKDGNAGAVQSNKVQAAFLPATMAVRRLTPRECERLQGFSDDYTLVPYRGKPAADGPRYKALGNSMAVNCMRWIGRRIQQVEGL